MAMKAGAKAVTSIPLEALKWAVQLRGGTYSAVREVSDIDNPFTKR
jgi:hypothetical protein